MDLKKINDETLLAQTEKLVKEEREILTAILHHLKEIERRRLFSTLKFGSLYEYCTKKLAYSEDQAYRRIAAMRLLREIPELEEKINSGSLTLTHLGMAQSHFKKEQKSSEQVMSKTEKIEILEKLENKSTREAEKIVFSLSNDSLPLMADKIKTVSESHVEIKFIANSGLVEKIQKLKSGHAHSHPDISLAELFDKLCDLGLENLTETAAPRKSTHRSKASIMREVKQRGCCENCGSDYALEVDHICPQALGGDSNLENLRLLCRTCNQRSAIEHFGVQKMESYIQRRH